MTLFPYHPTTSQHLNVDVFTMYTMLGWENTFLAMGKQIKPSVRVARTSLVPMADGLCVCVYVCLSAGLIRKDFKFQSCVIIQSPELLNK